ncbi:MAG: hypothetical protein NT007_09640 [Candidatus Kapabacteria bacterium]|nr:hypothetical protein [Candidatus Kapabacteria bacterium]
MEIKTTAFGQVIVREIEKFMQSPCLEATNNNDGECLYNLIQEFDQLQPAGNKKLQRSRQMAYCAMTATVILDRAFHTMGYQNPVRASGAKEFINVGRQNHLRLRTDKNPAPGAIMLTESVGQNGSTSGYHAGLVWYVNGNTVGTFEGNTSPGYIWASDTCVVKGNRDGIFLKQRTKNSIASFIHVEEFFDNLIASYSTAEFVNTFSGLNEGEFCATDIETQNTNTEESSDDVEGTLTPDPVENTDGVFASLGSYAVPLVIFGAISAYFIFKK